MTASPSALRLDVLDGNVALVTFDQPGSRANILGQAVQADFEAVLAQLRHAADLRGLILRSGKPGMFIAGADLKETGQPPPGTPTQKRRVVRRGLAIIAGFESLPYPTVAAIDGAVPGRRTGAGPGLRLPHRQHAPEDGTRLPRGEDRPVSRLGRHAAACRASSAPPRPPS